MNPVTNSLWTEKWRPNTLDGYVGNEYVMEKFRKYIEDDDVPHLLLHGRAGTGKTTAAKLLVNNLDCDVIYINASDENNIETIRTKIKTFVSSVGFKKWKIVILDEADHITLQAQAALRNVMETFSKHSRFILTCNYPEKILDPIKSRCTQFAILPPSKKEVAMRMLEILDTENVEYDKKDVATLVSAYYPDIRRIINAIQSDVIKGKLVVDKQTTLELDYMESVVNVLKGKGDPKSKYSTIRQIIADSGVKTFDDFFRYLFDTVNEYAPEGKQASVILEIAKAAKDDPIVTHKDINVISMIIEILSLIK